MNRGPFYQKFLAFNSLAPGRCVCNVELVIFKLIPRRNILSISCEIALMWMPSDWLVNIGSDKPVDCGLSMWGKIIIPMYRLWLNSLYGLYEPWCPLSSKRPINFISLSLGSDNGFRQQAITWTNVLPRSMLPYGATRPWWVNWNEWKVPFVVNQFLAIRSLQNFAYALNTAVMACATFVGISLFEFKLGQK